ncbi:hypothetical protein YQE_02142, partial [Dendroctonus ponderosae]
MKVNILTIVSGMELVNSIVALLSIDFHKLETDVKKEQQLRLKGNTVQNDSLLIGNLSNTSMALEYERSDMTRRLSILLGELLYIQSQIQENTEIVEPESYIKSSDLFDNDIFAEELSDIICIALAELPTTLTIISIVETLLHIHNGPEIVCRVVANFPDSFREVCTYLIQTGEKQEETISSTIRSTTIRLLCRMNPSQALTVRSKCVELCRMPALAILLSLGELQGDNEGDMVAFVSGLLLGNDQTIRNWIALFFRTGQKRKGEASSNALQQLREELLKRLQKIIDLSPEGQIPDTLVVQASALLRLYCALRGIAAIKFQDEEVNLIVQLLTSHPNPTPAGVQWLVREEAYFESASGVTASFGEMLLLMAIHFHSQQLSAICELTCATLGMKIAIRHNNMNRMKQVFTQEIFTEQVVTAHAVKVPVTRGLSATMTGFLPIHCIHQLLKSRAFAKHNVNIKNWIYKQICTSVSPLHPVLPMLVEVYVNSIMLPNSKTTEHTNKPLTENEIRRVFQSSVFGQYFDNRQSIFTMDFDLNAEDQDVVVDNTSLTPQLLLLYYLLLYEDCLFGPLLKLLATHFPHLTLVEDWLDDMSIRVEKKPVHIDEYMVVSAFNEIETNPYKCAKLLQFMLKVEAIDIWPFAESFAQFAKSVLGSNIPRYLQDLYKDVWLRLNTVLPRRLWVLTVKNLVEDFSLVTKIDVAEDPLQIMRCDDRVFRCAPIYAIVLRVLRASLASSRSQLTQHLQANPRVDAHGQIMNEPDREEICRATIAAQAKPKDPALDRNVLLNISFAAPTNILWDKLPVLDKYGEKVELNRQDFEEFLLIIRIYKDFQQKSKFSKLHKLRSAQRDLPIAQYKSEIVNKLKENRVLLIAGNTGCGKSTQVPQYVMEAGYTKVVCTQPRRIACISLAKRVAYETLTDFKSTIGYQIRFEKSKRADTSVIFMTEGLLLRQASEEETLNSYDVVILDEVHERHLHGDFLIDPFEKKRDKFNCTPYLQILQMIDEKYLPNQKGDVLIFLNGFSEISTLADAITEYRFVIDSGKCNRMIYNTNVGISKLSEAYISQDSAKQRSGRAGRTGPGVCYRMYSEEDFNSFEGFTPAEIHLVPLDSLILHMISLGLTDIENFPFLEKPSHKAIEESLEKLKFAGALSLSDDCLSLTPLGDSLSQLPVDLSIAKMLIMSTIFGNVNSVLALASLLSVQSPLTQTAYRDSEAQNLRRPLESNHGDPISLLSFFKEWLTIKQSSGPVQGSSTKSQNSKTWSKKRCLEEQRFYEVTKLLDQFRDILTEANLLQKIEEQLTSSERSIRYGELKQLKHMKYELKIESKSRQRKQLKYEMFNYGEDSEKADSKTDLRDVEFRITNDFKRLQKLLNEASADSFKDLMLLKIILTSGFYPQIAVEDEHNSSKTVSERLYHTKNKNYVFLRPMSYFAMNPEILELSNDEIEVPPSGYFSKRPISKKHQVLVFQSILETKKVYLVNAMRMPCIQTLFLFGKTISTNSSLTKFVVDDFLALDVPYLGQAKNLLLKALSLRQKWTQKLEFKLNNPTYKQSDADKEDIFYFIEDLVAYMQSAVAYNMKRLLPADLKDLFSYSSETFNHIKDKLKNPFNPGFAMCPNTVKGGFNVTENVIYDCLNDEDWAYAVEVNIFETGLLCKHCKETFPGRTLFQFMQHEEFCDSKAVAVKQETTEVETTVVKANSKKWHCDKCSQDLVLTPTEILKHRNSCK